LCYSSFKMKNMTLSEELKWRGFVNQTTYEDLSVVDKQKVTFYHGFDASSSSQTIGNLAAMMLDKAFIRHGHKCILVAGGSTSLVGDPGGKESERELQSEEAIAANVKNAETQLKKVFAGDKFIMTNNLDWTKNVKVLDFLRDYGKHFSMTNLVQRDFIAKRLGAEGSGISYAEFSYTLLQGYDFLYLYDTYQCTLQLGGSDQWGNCLSGVELIRRLRGAEAHVFTLPLIMNKATGKKFGKSEDGAIWLDEAKTSVYKFYQFWLNADDEGVEGYLKIFTELDKEQIDDIMAEFKADPSLRAAQKALAYEVTKMVHGKDRADGIKKITEVLFGGREYGELTAKDFAELGDELGVYNAKKGQELVDILVETKLASSKGEAKRFLESSAIYVNGYQIPLGKATLDKDDATHGYVVLRRGKNDQTIIKL
jgi:tyrosyl-tRNA synthetase